MSNSGRVTEQSAVYRWWQGYARAMTDLHRDPRIGPRLHEIVSAAGLRDVQVQYMRLPIGDWDPGTCGVRFVIVFCNDADARGPLFRVSRRFHHASVYCANASCTDPMQASIGRDTVDVVGDLLASMGLWAFTVCLGETAAWYNQLIREVRLELQNTELQLYLPM
jgi:hypothetical protein